MKTWDHSSRSTQVLPDGKLVNKTPKLRAHDVISDPAVSYSTVYAMQQGQDVALTRVFNCESGMTRLHH